MFDDFCTMHKHLINMTNIVIMKYVEE